MIEKLDDIPTIAAIKIAIKEFESRRRIMPNAIIWHKKSFDVSATISIREHEWPAVGEWMWENRDTFNGLSVLPYFGGSYTQAPFEDITKEQFDEMVTHLHNIDLSKVVEFSDDTALMDQAACAGGACEIV